MSNQRYAKLEIETAEGSESVAGTVLTTPWYLPAEEIGFVPNPNLLDRSNELRGIDGRVIGGQNEYAPTGSFNIRGYTRYMGALLYLLFGEVTTTAGNGTTVKDPEEAAIPVGAYKHVFKKKSGADPLTARLTLAYWDKWLRARGVTVGSMAFSLAEDGVQVTGQLLANYLNRLTVDPADVVTQEAFSVLPLRRRNVKLTTPELVATQLTDSLDFSLEQTLEPVRTLGSATGWPNATQRANSPEGFLRLQGSINRRDFDAVDWDALIAASVFGVKIAMQSEQKIGATSYPYSMWVETSKAQLTGGGPETLKNQARHESSYDWQAGSNEAGVNDFTVTVVNDSPSYTT